MNYEEARVYLEKVSKYGSVLGLEAMKELLDRLGNPQDDLKFVHISGTNGKGSVLAFLSTILTEAGYHIGRYVSPTLFAYRERIQVDGEMIEKEALARHVTAIAQAAGEMEREGKPLPTIFEQETALAFLYFKERHCDLVVLETGLGGTLDATNVVKTTVLAVIASIGMDHMEFLGNTLGEIAENKAGIMKPGIPVVSAFQEPEAAEVLSRVSREKECSLHFVEPAALLETVYGYEEQSFSYKEWKHMKIFLAGSYQMQNAALALEAVEQLRTLGYVLTEDQVRTGMAKTVWRGRFTLLHKDPVVIMDGAHNPPAAKVLKDSLERYFQGRKLYFIMGVFADKDYPAVIRMMAPMAERIFTVETPDNPRALPAHKLAAAVAEVNPSVQAEASVQEAVKAAMEAAGREGVVIAFGSLSYLHLVDEAAKESVCAS